MKFLLIILLIISCTDPKPTPCIKPVFKYRVGDIVKMNYNPNYFIRGKVVALSSEQDCEGQVTYAIQELHSDKKIGYFIREEFLIATNCNNSCCELNTQYDCAMCCIDRANNVSSCHMLCFVLICDKESAIMP
jgi:hypothetical protein